MIHVVYISEHLVVLYENTPFPREDFVLLNPYLPRRCWTVIDENENRLRNSNARRENSPPIRVPVFQNCPKNPVAP
uniref:Uncharacterized protein n=1 Tax=Anopheles minimus TaxID=112268 RepID=A0A182WPL5_9DIPT